MQSAEALKRGREAFARRAWSDAFEMLERDHTTALEPADLARLATAAYLTGRDERSTETWRRAHQAWLARGDVGRAVRSAFWLGFGLIQRGDMAQGGGWLARASPPRVGRGVIHAATRRGRVRCGRR